MDDSLVGFEQPVFDASCQAGFGLRVLFSVRNGAAEYCAAITCCIIAGIYFTIRRILKRLAVVYVLK